MSFYIRGRTLQQLLVDAGITGVALQGLLYITGPVAGLQPSTDLRNMLVTGVVVGVASSLGTVLNDYLIKQGLLTTGS